MNLRATSSHRITLPTRRPKYARCTAQDIRAMCQMRHDGYVLREIARVTDHNIPTVWRRTAHIMHRNWKRDRLVERPRTNRTAHLVRAA